MICGNMCIKSFICGRKTVYIAEYFCKNDGSVHFGLERWEGYTKLARYSHYGSSRESDKYFMKGSNEYDYHKTHSERKSYGP